MQMGGPTASLRKMLQCPQLQNRKWPTARTTPTDPGMTNLRLLMIQPFSAVCILLYFWLCWVFVAAQACSSCGSGGYSSLQGAGFSPGWLLLLWSMGSRVCWLELWFPGSRAQAQLRWLTGLAAPQQVGSSWIRDGTHVSCSRRQILYHWATREALHFLDFLTVSLQRAEPHVSPYNVNTNILIEFCQHYLCLIILFIMLI